MLKDGQVVKSWLHMSGVNHKLSGVPVTLFLTRGHRQCDEQPTYMPLEVQYVIIELCVCVCVIDISFVCK